jgi:hypothetical protein
MNFLSTDSGLADQQIMLLTTERKRWKMVKWKEGAKSVGLWAEKEAQ